MKHIHGGNIYQYENCIDFSANCNPLGTPKGVIQAAKDSLEQIYAYPRVGYGPLRDAIAAYEGVTSGQVICGNGAAELIFTLCRALNPKHALLCAPTFAEYEQALESVDCTCSHYQLKEEDDFALTMDFLKELHEGLDIVFLCNPNNPTGVLIDRVLLVGILEKCQKLGIFLVVDECFLDFVKQPEKYTLKEALPAYENLFLLKAFTKRYGMAGIRLGYGLSDNKALLEKMEAATQPWNVSGVAQAAGVAALGEEAFVQTARKLIFQEANILKKELQALGYRVYPSSANYIFFRGEEDLFEKCVAKGILIRDCSNYEGLTAGYYRIAVKTPQENEKLLKALREIKRG